MKRIALERILFAKTGKNADGQFGGGLDCRFINANLEQSVNLYRMDRDENMELVVGNATRMFPSGSLSRAGVRLWAQREPVHLADAGVRWQAVCGHL